MNSPLLIYDYVIPEEGAPIGYRFAGMGRRQSQWELANHSRREWTRTGAGVVLGNEV